MTIRVGINGFGRIGKLIFKILRKRGIEVPIINDPFIDTEYMAYLLKYDTVHGKDNTSIKQEEGKISYFDKDTYLTTFKNPEDINWQDHQVDIVVEASGVFLSIEDCKRHKGVKKVVITAPSKDAPMFVYGVNHKEYKNEEIVSCASCTTNCLAPLVKVVHDRFEILEGLMTTVHSVTATQKIVDGITKKNKRDGRSGMSNIIPASTGAAGAVEKVITSLKGRLTGMAMRVPVLNVSVVDLVCRTEKKTSLREIKEAIEEEAGSMEGVIGVTEEEVVSSDFIGDDRSSIFDYKASMAMGENFFKLICWYDNEFGYSNRIVDFLIYMHHSSLRQVT